jgi:hypothetical protein
MSAASFTHACPVCGAEESLDALLARVVDDAEARGLVADVISLSLPLGTLAVRYLRIHTPPKQKLRLSMVKALLSELVPDMQRAYIERKGRVWATPPAAWTMAFQAVFDAHERGTLSYPLRGNAYLYEVLMRQADKAEAGQERESEANKRGRGHQAGAVTLGDVITKVESLTADMNATTAALGAKIESPTVRRFKAEAAARKAARQEPQL